jgi:chemotaxis protein methyltransferase WspC
VPETWFFRDRESFAALAVLVRDECLSSQGEDVLNLLSLPCSTGEEPYSMAMALLDAGIPADRFHVDGVDISARALAQAAHAVYGRNSFRGQELAFRGRHFDATAEGYRLREIVRHQVRFQYGNLLANGFLPGAEAYDVIFCRNVLIYFDCVTQDRAILVLKRLLTPKGVLFVAPSETSLPLSHDLVSTNVPLAFAFRRRGAIPRDAKPKATHPVQPLPVRPHVVQPLPAPHVTRPAATTPAATVQSSPQADVSVELEADLHEATRLADQGHFVEAATCCEAYLRRHGPSATAFYLMGLVRDATGKGHEAGSYYRKALYLDPDRCDAQIQLAFLLEKQGDAAGAQVLRNRARRLEQKIKAAHE